MGFDVVTLGEAMLRLSVPPGLPLESVDTFNVHVAGAEANTAIALASMNREVAWWSLLPETPLGRRVDRELRASGVDTTHVVWVPGGRIGIYYVDINEPPRPVSVVYDRANSTAAQMERSVFPYEILESASVAHLSGITPALSEDAMRLSHDFAHKAHDAGCRVTIDINYRAKLWSPDVARDTLLGLAKNADVVVLTREDAHDVFGLAGSPEEVLARAQALFEAGTAVLTLGDRGAMWVSNHGSGLVEAIPTTVVDRLGAGDAFMAGVIEGLLEDDVELGLRIGTVLASIALGTRGDHVITSREEVQRILDGRGRSVDR